MVSGRYMGASGHAVRGPRFAVPTRWLAVFLAGMALLLHAVPSAAQTEGLDPIRGALRSGKFLQAERNARELLATTERLHGADSREVADVLDLLSEALRKGGKGHDPEALVICVRAVAIRERLATPNDPSLAASLENLGALHLQNGRIDEARSLLQRALEVRTRLLGPSHPEVAWSLIWLANLEYTAGRDDSARVMAQRAVAIQDSTLPDDDLKRTYGLGLLASIQFRRGEFREAAALYERVLGLRLGSLGLDNPSTADALHNLGAVYSEMGDYAEAQRYFEQARDVMRRVLPPIDPMIPPNLHGLAMVREKQGDPAGALALFREAHRAERAAMGPDHSMVGGYLMQVGRLELVLGRPAAARRALTDALKIQEHALGPNHPELAWTLRSLSEADARAHSVDLALGRCGRALRIQESALGPHHPDLAPTLVDLARYHSMQGDTTGALELALRASRIRADHLRLTSGGLSERQALAYAGKGPTGLDVALPLVLGVGVGGSPSHVREVWDALVRVRTLVLDEMAARHNASLRDTLDEKTGSAVRVLRGARQRLANLLVHGPGDDPAERYREQLRTARLEVERAERALGFMNSSLAATSMSRPGLAEVLGAVPRGWGLVAYASYASESGRRYYVAFVQGVSGEPSAIPIGDATRIDRLVNQWASAIVAAAATTDERRAAQGEAASRAAGLELRRAVWDPVVGALGTTEGILIVPDGSLQGVPFGALPDSGKSYVVERNVVLHYVTSELDIAATRSRRQRGTGLLAFGGVDFGEEPPDRKRSKHGSDGSSGEEADCEGFYDATFRSLPESRAEVDEIAGAWGAAGRATVMTGAEATEGAFKRLAPGTRVIHLATHGFFLNPNRCLQELASVRGIGRLEPAVRPRARPAFDQTSPLLLSGLALAAANRRSEATPHEEDGILTAEEVASLDLRGVEWAVLSACDTGIATATRGEGVLGLRRAFRIAGVSTLVISLWPVQDEAARDWMRALYTSRNTGGSATAAAVRSATLEVLRARRAQGRSTSPFFWAAFVATGDWD